MPQLSHNFFKTIGLFSLVLMSHLTYISSPSPFLLHDNYLLKKQYFFPIEFLSLGFGQLLFFFLSIFSHILL